MCVTVFVRFEPASARFEPLPLLGPIRGEFFRPSTGYPLARLLFAALAVATKRHVHDFTEQNLGNAT